MKKYKILLIAIGVSLGWHLLCMSAINIVASPIPSRTVMFGKVSFLGPMVSRVGIELKLSPRQRSFLEKRYQARLEETYSGNFSAGSAEYAAPDTGSISERGIKGLIVTAVTGPKLEPDRMMQS